MIDVGLTHIALPVTDIEKSVAFYSKYARMEIVHRRSEQSTGSDVVWISDKTRPFVIVLIGMATVENKLLPFAHLGVGCESREEVDRLCEEAREEGALNMGPYDSRLSGWVLGVHQRSRWTYIGSLARAGSRPLTVDQAT